jgi:hypothetical protein
MGATPMGCGAFYVRAPQPRRRAKSKDGLTRPLY